VAGHARHGRRRRGPPRDRPITDSARAIQHRLDCSSQHAIARRARLDTMERGSVGMIRGRSTPAGGGASADDHDEIGGDHGRQGQAGTAAETLRAPTQGIARSHAGQPGASGAIQTGVGRYGPPATPSHPLRRPPGHDHGIFAAKSGTASGSSASAVSGVVGLTLTEQVVIARLCQAVGLNRKVVGVHGSRATAVQERSRVVTSEQVWQRSIIRQQAKSFFRTEARDYQFG
jgi:hypothetical protein